MQPSHILESTDFSSGSIPLDNNTIIPFSLICPS